MIFASWTWWTYAWYFYTVFTVSICSQTINAIQLIGITEGFVAKRWSGKKPVGGSKDFPHILFPVFLIPGILLINSIDKRLQSCEVFNPCQQLSYQKKTDRACEH